MKTPTHSTRPAPAQPAQPAPFSRPARPTAAEPSAIPTRVDPWRPTRPGPEPKGTSKGPVLDILRPPRPEVDTRPDQLSAQRDPSKLPAPSSLVYADEVGPSGGSGGGGGGSSVAGQPMSIAEKLLAWLESPSPIPRVSWGVATAALAAVGVTAFVVFKKRGAR